MKSMVHWQSLVKKKSKGAAEFIGMGVSGEVLREIRLIHDSTSVPNLIQS